MFWCSFEHCYFILSKTAKVKRIEYCFRLFLLVTCLNTSRVSRSGILIFGEAINTFSRLFKMFSQMWNLSCGCEINAGVFNYVVTNTQIRISVLKSNYKLKLTSGVLIKRWDWEIVKCNFLILLSSSQPPGWPNKFDLFTANSTKLSQMPWMTNNNNQD